jgi:hypothetical protein
MMVGRGGDMSKIIDCVMYNGEKELFDLRYNILKDVVDEFIVVEAPTTFSSKKKPLYFEQIRRNYDKVSYFVVDEHYSPEELALAENSPNTNGADHWKREFLQKESIKKALVHLKDEDIVFIGDCDEVWDAEKALKWCHAPFKYKLKVYTYYLNNSSSEEFWGTLVSPYKHLKNDCLNHLRTNAWKTVFDAGWHFTSMAPDLRRKLTDSYTKETYANDWVMDNLQANIRGNKDFLGRSFTYKIDESEWPQYLKDNKDKYKLLCKSFTKRAINH